MRKSGKWLYAFLALLLFAVTASGCFSKSEQGVFRDTGAWPKPPAFQHNPFNADVGWALYNTAYEGLYAYVAVSGTAYKRLAENLEHKGNQTIVTIRKDVKWNDGTPFTSKDIWAYYTLNNTVGLMRLITNIETPDDYTVVFTWNDPVPNDSIKLNYIAVDRQAMIPYHIFGKYVDRAAELLKQGKPSGDPAVRGAYGYEFDEETIKALDENWTEFKKHNPETVIGTGPYMLEKVTASDMILKKNPHYYLKDNVKFEKLHLKQVDANTGFAMLKSGQVERADGTPNKDILESILRDNEDLIHYQTLDNATVGLVFNIGRKPFDDVNFRRALLHVFDKEKIREVGNYYGKTSEYSFVGMPFSYASEWIEKDVLDKMTKYPYDPDKAASMLEELGWKKGSDGVWADKDGKTYSFIISAPSNTFQFTNPAQVAAEQLTQFGFPTQLKAVDGSIFYTNAQYPKNEYDISVSWAENSWGLYNPYGALSGFYDGFAGLAGNLPRFEDGPNKGKLNLALPGPDGEMIDIRTTLNAMLSMSEEDMKKTGSKLSWIANENAFGLPAYQNVSGFWLNKKTVKGYPLPELVEQYNRDVPVPEDPEQLKIANDHWYLWAAQGLQFANGEYAPNTD